MDITKEPQRIISFCTGIQGLERGLKRAGITIQPVCYVEIESFINENLVSGMEQGLVDEAPIWSNAKTFDGHPFRGMVHGFIGGYPCQPFSLAGQRKGIEDPRHLYPHIERHIGTVGPIWCFFENVSGHLTLGFPEVRESLSNLGYKVEAGIFTAEEVGAPHKRERLFILAIKRGYKLDYANSSSTRNKISTGRKPITLSSVELANPNSSTNGNNKQGFQPKITRGGDELSNAENQRMERRSGADRTGGEHEPIGGNLRYNIGSVGEGSTELADTSGAERRPPIQTGFPQPNGDDGERGKTNGGLELCGEDELGNADNGRCQQPNSRFGVVSKFNEGYSKLGDAQHDGQPTEPQLRGRNEAGDRPKEEQGTPCQPSGTDRPDDDKSLSRSKMANANNSGGEQDRQSGEFRPSGIIQPSLNCGTADKGEDHEGEWPAGPGQPQHPWESPRTVGFTDRLPRSVRKLWRDLRPHFAKTMGEKVWQETDRNIKAAVEPLLGVTVDGYNFREDLLRAAGNSVVEQTASLAFVTLLEKHNKQPP